MKFRAPADPLEEPVSATGAAGASWTGSGAATACPAPMVNAMAMPTAAMRVRMRETLRSGVRPNISAHRRRVNHFHFKTSGGFRVHCTDTQRIPTGRPSQPVGAPIVAS